MLAPTADVKTTKAQRGELFEEPDEESDYKASDQWRKCGTCRNRFLSVPVRGALLGSYGIPLHCDACQPALGAKVRAMDARIVARLKPQWDEQNAFHAARRAAREAKEARKAEKAARPAGKGKKRALKAPEAAPEPVLTPAQLAGLLEGFWEAPEEAQK